MASGCKPENSYLGRCLAGWGLEECREYSGGTACLFIEFILLSHSYEICSVKCVDKNRICVPQSALPTLSVNAVFMQKQLGEKTKTPMHVHICIWVSLFWVSCFSWISRISKLVFCDLWLDFYIKSHTVPVKYYIFLSGKTKSAILIQLNSDFCDKWGKICFI